MTDSTGLQFTVKVGALPQNTFAVAAFDLDEQLNTPFLLSLDLASLQPDIDAADVLEQPCELLIWFDGELQRRVNGVVSQFSQGDTGFRRTRYRLAVRPALWRLSLRHNARMFQALTPQEIISILLQEAGVTDYAFALKDSHAQREYCVQYRETDLAFLARLTAEEGMCWYHEFTSGKHSVVFSDHHAALQQGPALFFNLANQGQQLGPFVRRFHYVEAVRPAEVELKDYCFKTPAYALSHRQQGSALAHQQDHYQHFDYPGRFKQDPSGKALSGYRLDALRADALRGQGESNAPQLQPGMAFTLNEHPNAKFNVAWQVVGIRHTGQQPQALEEEGGSEPTLYYNQFAVIPADMPWRGLMPHKPMVDGPQIATVVGPAGEEIYCDNYGRVRLQFPWDRYGASNEQSSCWVRVSQEWAGGQYGTMVLPRVGHEVIVSFLDGDPDQPIVTGRTYHATQRPAYPLPQHKTRTVLRTMTHQGQGFNELRFEDQAGQEEIYIHGQKDLNALIEQDAAWHITHDEHCAIDNERVTRIKANDHLTVDVQKREHIQADYSLTVDTNMHQKVGQSLLVDAGTEVHINVGEKLVLEAGSELTLSGGGSFVKLDPSGIKLVGPDIKLNAGGSPGVGASWAGQAPALPKGIGAEKAPEPVELIKALPTEEAMEALLKERMLKMDYQPSV